MKINFEREACVAVGLGHLAELAIIKNKDLRMRNSGMPAISKYMRLIIKS